MGCVFSSSKAATTSEIKLAKTSKTGETVQASDVEKKKHDEEEAPPPKEDKKPSKGDRRRSTKPNPRLSNPSKHWRGEQVAAGWPSWLSDACGEALNGWVPRKADTFEKIDKVFFTKAFAFFLFFFGIN